MFDTQALVALQQKWLSRHASAFLLRESADGLKQRLGWIRRSFSPVLQAGFWPEEESVPENLPRCVRLVGGQPKRALSGVVTLVGSPWAIPLADRQVEAVLVNAWPFGGGLGERMLQEALRVLKPDGCLLAVVVAEGSLSELKAVLMAAEHDVVGRAYPRVYPFDSCALWASRLQSVGFALPVVDTVRLTLTYASLQELAQDVRDAGMACVLDERSRGMLHPRVWARAEDLYRRDYSDDEGRLQATFESAVLLGWAPGGGQPKALRPGQAGVSFQDFLDTLAP